MSKEKKFDKKAIEGVFEGILWKVEKENQETFRIIFDGLAKQGRKPNIDSPKEFFYSLTFKLESFLQDIWKNKFAGLSVIDEKNLDLLWFLYANYHFVSNHFEKLIYNVEWHSCSGDKEHWIIYAIEYYLVRWEYLEMDMTKEYTYHYPNVLFENVEQMVMLLKGIYRLYYGDFEKYGLAVKEIMDGVPERKRQDILRSMKKYSDLETFYSENNITVSDWLEIDEDFLSRLEDGSVSEKEAIQFINKSYRDAKEREKSENVQVPSVQSDGQESHNVEESEQQESQESVQTGVEEG